jgi:hypothetical protein
MECKHDRFTNETIFLIDGVTLVVNILYALQFSVQVLVKVFT